MTFLKSASAALLALATLAGPVAAKDWSTIRVGTEGAYPPFNLIDSNGELQGFDVDIAHALCDRMKATCTLAAQDWDGIIPALLANKFDMLVASMTITEERAKIVAFTDSYYQTPLALIGSKDAPDDVSPESMDGLIVGAQAGTTQATHAEEAYAPAGAEIKLYPTQEEANLDLVSGRVDRVIADKFVLMDWLKTGDGACCKLIGDAPGTDSRAGITVRQEDEDLREMVNKALAEIRADGTYDAIRAKYFDFDIF